MYLTVPVYYGTYSNAGSVRLDKILLVNLHWSRVYPAAVGGRLYKLVLKRPTQIWASIIHLLLHTISWIKFCENKVKSLCMNIWKDNQISMKFERTVCLLHIRWQSLSVQKTNCVNLPEIPWSVSQRWSNCDMTGASDPVTSSFLSLSVIFNMIAWEPPNI